MPHRYSQETRCAVVDRRKRGMSWSSIVREVRAIKDAKAARNIWNKYMSTAEVADLPVSGRPMVLTPAMTKRIDSALAADPWLAPADLVADLHLPVSERTVRRYRKEHYHPVKGVGRPVLSTRNQRLRLNWARQHVNDSFDDWVFTDEKSFFLFKVQRQAWVKIGAELPFRTQPAHPPRVQVLGGISRHGRTKLVVFGGWLNGEQHRKNLDAIMPSIHRLYPDGCHYLQDNDPSHMDKQSLRHLKSLAVAAQKMPAQSPDFNVQEHVWAALDRRVAARSPQSVAELERVIKDEWSRITVDECNRYIDGLQPTLRAVIAAGGLHVAPQDRRRYGA
jgi:DDE superfamily endonuclease/Transposase